MDANNASELSELRERLAAATRAVAHARRMLDGAPARDPGAPPG